MCERGDPPPQMRHVCVFFLYWKGRGGTPPVRRPWLAVGAGAARPTARLAVPPVRLSPLPPLPGACVECVAHGVFCPVGDLTRRARAVSIPLGGPPPLPLPPPLLPFPPPLLSSALPLRPPRTDGAGGNLPPVPHPRDCRRVCRVGRPAKRTRHVTGGDRGLATPARGGGWWCDRRPAVGGGVSQGAWGGWNAGGGGGAATLMGP